MAQLNERFEALEYQLDLPAQSVTLQHLAGGRSTFRQSGEYQDIAGILPILRRVAVFARLLLAHQSAMGPLDRFLTLANTAKASRDALLARWHPDRPFRRFACSSQRLELLPQGKQAIFLIPQPQRPAIQAHTEVRVLSDNLGNAWWTAITGIGQH